jgi:hypothetical protein
MLLRYNLGNSVGVHPQLSHMGFPAAGAMVARLVLGYITQVFSCLH